MHEGNLYCKLHILEIYRPDFMLAHEGTLEGTIFAGRVLSLSFDNSMASLLPKVPALGSFSSFNACFPFSGYGGRRRRRGRLRSGHQAESTGPQCCPMLVDFSRLCSAAL